MDCKVDVLDTVEFACNAPHPDVAAVVYRCSHFAVVDAVVVRPFLVFAVHTDRDYPVLAAGERKMAEAVVRSVVNYFDLHEIEQFGEDSFHL